MKKAKQKFSKKNLLIFQNPNDKLLDELIEGHSFFMTNLRYSHFHSNAFQTGIEATNQSSMIPSKIDLHLKDKIYQERKVYFPDELFFIFKWPFEFDVAGLLFSYLITDEYYFNLSLDHRMKN